MTPHTPLIKQKQPRVAHPCQFPGAFQSWHSVPRIRCSRGKEKTLHHHMAVVGWGRSVVPTNGDFLPPESLFRSKTRQHPIFHDPLLTIPKKPGLSSGTWSSGYTVFRNHRKSLHWSLSRSFFLSVTSPKGSWENKIVESYRSWSHPQWNH